MRERERQLTDEQIRALERFNPEFRERHIEIRGPGDPVAVDTFHVGTLEGIGQVYMQSAIDCHTRYAWGRACTQPRSRLPRFTRSTMPLCRPSTHTALA